MTKFIKIVLLIFISSFFLKSFPQSDTTILSLKYRIQKLPFGLIKKVPSAEPSIALAFSGGGARGLAQIGVLKAFEDSGIPINIIVGTSMGSVIGGLYAAGYSVHQLDSISVNTDWNALLASDRETNRRELFVDQKITEDKAIFSLRLNGFTPVLPTYINSGQKISNFFNLLTFQAPVHTDSSFDELRTRFRAVCTDLVSGNPVIINKGSLSQAMRASSSVSFLLPPVKIDSLILVDGGLVANIPVSTAEKIGGDLTVAVNTTSDLHSKNELALPWIVADQIVSIPMKLLNTEQINNADFVVTPDLGDRGADDFSDIDSIISDGYAGTIPYVNKIKERIDSVFYKKTGENIFYLKNIMIPSGANDIDNRFDFKYSAMDSVSSFEILKDMATVMDGGDIDSVYAVIIEGENYSTVKFIPVYNPSVRSVRVKGVTLIDSSVADSAFSLLEGKPYNANRIYNRLLSIINLYRKSGYSLATIKNIRFNKRSGQLDIVFDEGRIDKIKIDGNKYTSSSIITREFPIIPGDYFNFDAAELGLINLRSTNLFDDVVLTVQKDKHENILVLNVAEKASSLLRFGFRVDNEKKVQLSFDIRDENLFGSGTEFGVLLFGGSRNRAYILEHKSNRIFDTYLTYKLNAFYKFDDVYKYTDDPSTSDKFFSRSVAGEYRQIYYGGSVAIGMQVKRFGNLIIQTKYQTDRIKNLYENTVIPEKINLVTLKASTTIDTQDKYPFPRQGFYFTGSYETAQTKLGSDLGYANFNFDYKSYFTFDRSYTVSPRIKLGFADKTLPLSEQYSLGGQNSFFGMREDEYRGRQIFITSLEYRYKLPVKIFFDTYFSMRYDLGSAWDEQEQIRFKDLKHGVGATLAFDTPIGPASFSAGRSFIFKKNLPGTPISFGGVMFYFSIGYYY